MAAQGVSNALAQGLLSRMKRKVLRTPPPVGPELVLAAPRWLILAARICGAIVGGLAIGLPSAAWLMEDASLWRLSAFATPILGAMAVGVVLEFRVRLTVDRQGIRGRTAFRGARGLRWVDVQSVDWSGSSHYLVLRTRDEVLRVSAWLVGFLSMAQTMRERVPEAVWRTADTKLRATLDGIGLVQEATDASGPP